MTSLLFSLLLIKKSPYIDENRIVVHTALEFVQGYVLEGIVGYCQNLVYQQNIRLQVGSHREGQTHIHPAGVALYRCIQELLNLGKGHNPVELAVNLCSLHSLASKVHTDLLWYNSQ